MCKAAIPSKPTTSATTAGRLKKTSDAFPVATKMVTCRKVFAEEANSHLFLKITPTQRTRTFTSIGKPFVQTSTVKTIVTHMATDLWQTSIRHMYYMDETKHHVNFVRAEHFYHQMDLRKVKI